MVTIDDYKINPAKKILVKNNVHYIYIPLTTCDGYKYSPTVNIDDYVYIGTIIGKSKVIDIPLVSSVSGVFVGFQDKYLANGKLTRCMVIENDFKEIFLNKVGRHKNIANYTKEEYIHLLKKCAISNMILGETPSYIKYDTNKKIDYLIVNGCDGDIYTSSEIVRMYNNPEEILEATDAIMEIMNITKAYIAINEKQASIIKKFLRYINTYPNIKIYAITDGYPNGYNKYLVNEILGFEYNDDPMEVNTIVDNVSTIYAIYETLKYNKPLIEKIVTVSGDGIKTPSNYLVRIGTNFNELIMEHNGYNKLNNPILITGGALNGKIIKNDELIITSDLSTILVLDDKKEDAMACIRCGKCSEVCPCNLIPSMIIDDSYKYKNSHIEKCINCGLCSYICPSKIAINEKIAKIREEKYE